MSHLINNLPLVIQDSAAVESLAGAIKDDMGMLWMLLSGILVFFMQAGFTLVESGMTRSKNAVNIAMKNLLDICVGSLTYWLVGYSLMYGDTSNGWFFWSGLFQGEGADLFFQTMFAATAATIVSGAIAGRTKYSTYAIFSIVMTAIIYPISGGWQWQGSGWLTELGFIDFAGSSIVHSVGGWAALIGAWMVGPRIGKYTKDGKTVPFMASNLPLATLGTFILWMGWFGFNGGSQLAMGSIGDVADVSRIFANTNAAAAAGSIAALILTQILYKKPDLTMVLNGALAGLVAITAEPLTPTLGSAAIIGAIGGVIVVFGVPLLDKLKIDDVVGAIPVHLFAGIWGTIAVVFTNSDASLSTQLYSIIVVGLFTFIASGVLWYVIKSVSGIRVSEEDEITGLDISELGMPAYDIVK